MSTHTCACRKITGVFCLFVCLPCYHCALELKETQKKGLIVQSTHILAVADPDACVGSGGATLNALLVAAELLSSQDGYTVSIALQYA